MTETAVKGEEDIADDVLENICKMSGVEQNIQVQNVIKVHIGIEIEKIIILSRHRTCLKLVDRKQLSGYPIRA